MKKATAVLGLGLALILGLSACNGGNNNGSSGTTGNASAKTTAENFMKSVKNGDWAGLSNIVISNDENKEVAGLLTSTDKPDIKSLLFEKLAYTVESVEENANTATATVSIEIPDYAATGKEYTLSSIRYILEQATKNQEAKVDDAATQEHIASILKETLNKTELTASKATATLKMELQENVWKVIPDQAFWDTLTGGFYKAANSTDIQKETERITQEFIDNLAKQ